jgi:hypothetical protein
MDALNVLARYLKRHPSMHLHFPRQVPADTVEVFVDSDWSGCRSSRTSTSGWGGDVWRGLCQVLELDAGVRCPTERRSGALLHDEGLCCVEALGLKRLSMDLGFDVKAVVRSDASAALVMANCRGAGRLRHVETRFLWLQDCISTGRLEVVKVARADNPGVLYSPSMSVPVKLQTLQNL